MSGCDNVNRFPGVVGVCPSCGRKFALHEAHSDARARVALRAALGLDPTLVDPILVYLDLFSPPTRALRADRLAKILDELSRMVRAGQITYERKTLTVTLEMFRVALQSVGDRRDNLDIPLPNHNYLLKTIVNMHKRADAQREEKQHHAAATRTRRVSSSDKRGQYSEGVQAARHLLGDKKS